MLIYEVTVSLADGVGAEFRKYLAETHVPDMMRTGCFDSATLEEDVETQRLRVRYSTKSDRLSEYLDLHADRLRGDAVSRFPAGVEAARETWTVVAEFGPAGIPHDKLYR